MLTRRHGDHRAQGRHGLPRGQHRLVLPERPNDTEKYTYIERHLPYLAAVMTIGFVAATSSQIWFEVTSGWWPFAIFTFVYNPFIRVGSAVIVHRARLRHRTAQ